MPRFKGRDIGSRILNVVKMIKITFRNLFIKLSVLVIMELKDAISNFGKIKIAKKINLNVNSKEIKL